MTAEIKKAVVDEVKQRELQWGRGPMTAEITATRAIPPRWFMLQWGRGPMTAEMCSVQDACAGLGKASMGPRSDDRGDSSG